MSLQQQLLNTKATAFDKIIALESDLSRLVQERNQLGEILRRAQSILGMEQEGIDPDSFFSVLEGLKAEKNSPKVGPEEA